MSNLGHYQVITTLSKRIGGPYRLLGAVLVTGVTLGIVGVKAHDRIKKNSANKLEGHDEKKLPDPTIKLYEIHSDGVSNEGLILKKGSKYKVLETDGESILIELIGDENNPYYVSRSLLNQISDFAD